MCIRDRLSSPFTTETSIQIRLMGTSSSILGRRTPFATVSISTQFSAYSEYMMLYERAASKFKNGRMSPRPWSFLVQSKCLSLTDTWNVRLPIMIGWKCLILRIRQSQRKWLKKQFATRPKCIASNVPKYENIWLWVHFYEICLTLFVLQSWHAWRRISKKLEELNQKSA